MDSIHIYQFYYRLLVFGLPFFMLAYQAMKLRRRPNTSATWLLLAWFGLGYGLAEWLAIFTSEPSRPAALELLRVAIVASSLFALLEFGRGQARIFGRLLSKVWIYPPLMILIFIGVQFEFVGLDVACRYVLGIPGGILAGLALWQMSRSSAGLQQRGLLVGAASLWLAVPLICLITPITALASAGETQSAGLLADAQYYIQAVFAVCALGVWAGLGLYRSDPELAAERKPLSVLNGIAALVVLLIAISFVPIGADSTNLSETETQGDPDNTMQIAIQQENNQPDRSWEHIMAERRQKGWNFLKGAMLIVVCLTCITYCCYVCQRVLRHKSQCDIYPKLH
jgi:hypothetical protein